jgi:hypothetical protein
VSRFRVVFAFSMLVSSVVTGSAIADEPATVGLVVYGCPRGIDPSLREILEIELATITETDAETNDATIRASVTCRGTFVDLRVERVDTHQILEDRITVANPSAPTTARSIALVLTELIAATRPEDELDPAVEDDDPVTFVPVDVPWLMDAVVVLRFGADNGPHMAGLRAGLIYVPRTFLRLSAGAEWLTGARGTTLGRVRSTALTADAALGIGYTVESKWIGVDLGLRMGAMLWTGNDDGADVQASRAAKPFVALFGRLVGELPVSDLVRLRGAFELGPVLVGSTADAVDTSSGTPVVLETIRADRYFLSLALGVSLAL